MSNSHFSCSAAIEDDDQFLDRVEKALPNYVSDRARLLASTSLDDIDSEWRGEDRIYYMARWFDAAMESSDGGRNPVANIVGAGSEDAKQPCPSDHITAPAQPTPDKVREALAEAYLELKKHAADYHHRTPDDVNNRIVDALAALPPAAPVETDALGVIESDRLFAEHILADFGAFEEGITDKEKLAQWIRNVRRASSTPDDPPLQSSSAGNADTETQNKEHVSGACFGFSRQSARETALEAVALDFIAKVDCGEARSKRSYAAFKAALSIPTEPQHPAAAPLMDADSICGFLHKHMPDQSLASLAVASRALADHLRVLRAVPQPAPVAADAADAARYRYLKMCCSYYYPEGHNPPSPREFGIEWHWQDSTPERPDMDSLIDRGIEEKRALYENDKDEALSLSRQNTKETS